MGALACLQLANSKIYREGFPPARIRIVGTTFAKHLFFCSLIMEVFNVPGKLHFDVNDVRGLHFLYLFIIEF